MKTHRIKKKISDYRFEIKHIAIFITILIIFQIVLALVQKSIVTDFLFETQEWYKKDSAERVAILTSTSMELLFQNLFMDRSNQQLDSRNIINSFNVLFRQQLLQKSVEDIRLILMRKNKIYIIKTGQEMYDYFANELNPADPNGENNSEIIQLFTSVKDIIRSDEVIQSEFENQRTFNILVPFVPDGEYLGVLYMRITPDFKSLTEEVGSNFDKISLIYITLMFFGLLGIFLVSLQAVKDRDEAQKKLYSEHEENLKKEIQLEKESLFTKRIYHTHHKAEKIMGFIKEDVRKMTSDNLDEIKNRVITYSNFISRIIYDMKWYDQAINTIINPMFRTDINKVIGFVIDNIFLRISSKNEMFEFRMDLDESLPFVNVNEFVIWEILEPLIQNSIDHGQKSSLNIKIQTRYDKASNTSYIFISDNGVGISPGLLEFNENKIKKIFLESESTAKQYGIHSGYGCYIAYQMAVGRCGWILDAENPEEGGCKFTITIKNR